MTGASYGGIIQYIVAGLDPRIDVIEPAYAPYSMLDTFAPFGKFKEGWGAALTGAGAQTIPYGLVSPAGPQLHPVDQGALQLISDGATTGGLSDSGRAYLERRSASTFIDRIHIPTLFQLGTTDTLFGTDATRAAAALMARQVPVKMVWNCEGHSICLKSPGETDFFDRTAIRWFDRWLKRDPASCARTYLRGPRGPACRGLLRAWVVRRQRCHNGQDAKAGEHRGEVRTV